MPGAPALNVSTALHIAVECRGIKKSFGKEGSEVWALRGVDITVTAGELLMLVGPSGCGKTTLLSIIAAILQEDAGECNVLGQSYSAMRNADKLDFRAKHIGFIFQQFNLLPSLTIAENVAVPLIINGTPRKQAVSQAEEMLYEVGLGERVNHQPSQLSGGQQQRVAIARALVHSPSLLLCDEPTSALDHETGLRIMDLMNDLNKKRGVTLIIVTHDNRIFPYAHRIAHMDDGMIDRIYLPGNEKETTR